MKEAQTLPKQLPGTVHVQMVKCGRSSCGCMKAGGRKHGPYLYWFHREDGYLRKQYLRAADVDPIRDACEARREAQRAVKKSWAQWREQLAQLRKLERHE
jgi:uncharacterized protein DUF6788